MSVQLRIILLCLTAAAVIFFVGRIKKNKMALKYTFSWLLLLIIMLLLIIFPGVLSWIAGIMGIDTPIYALFILGFIFSLVVIYTLTEAVTKINSEISSLTQEVAILKKSLHDAEDAGKKD
ncbi:MAG: DUF2304 domain-containing protein [Oscillospiraceae bacterium]|jgi:hypothetical protein